MSNVGTAIKCPACGLTQNGTSVSELWSLIQCSACTHVFTTQLPDNRRFEASDYVAWRDQAKAEFVETARRRYRTVQEQIPEKHGRVLELGCSTGEVLAEFARNGWQAVGSDFSKLAIEAARERNPGITFYNADEKDILDQEGPGSFDLIMAFHVIEHVPDIEQLMLTLRRLCKPDGHLFLAFPYWDAWSRKVFGDAWPDFAPEHLHFFTRQSIDGWLRRGDSSWFTPRAGVGHGSGSAESSVY